MGDWNDPSNGRNQHAGALQCSIASERRSGHKLPPQRAHSQKDTLYLKDEVHEGRAPQVQHSETHCLCQHFARSNFRLPDLTRANQGRPRHLLAPKRQWWTGDHLVVPLQPSPLTWRQGTELRCRRLHPRVRESSYLLWKRVHWSRSPLQKRLAPISLLSWCD